MNLSQIMEISRVFPKNPTISEYIADNRRLISAIIARTETLENSLRLAKEFHLSMRKSEILIGNSIFDYNSLNNQIYLIATEIENLNNGKHILLEVNKSLKDTDRNMRLLDVYNSLKYAGY